MRKPYSLLALFALLLAAPMLADDFAHLRRSTLTTYNESILSAINLPNDTVESVIANLGAPTHVTKTSSSVRSYEWERKTCRLKILALDSGSIIRVDVWGTAPDSTIGATGRGLRLGATIDDARRLYVRFAADIAPAKEWYWDCPPSDTKLEIDFNKNGRIDHMKLTMENGDCVISQIFRDNFETSAQ